MAELHCALANCPTSAGACRVCCRNPASIAAAFGLGGANVAYLCALLHLLLWAAGNTDCSVHVARLDMSRYIVIRCDIGARVLPLRDDFNPRHSVSVAGGFSCRDAGLAPIGSEQSREYLAASQSCSICEAPPHRASRLIGFRRVRPREAARDTIFDRQRATWRNEPHAVGVQASPVEHQALAASRGLFSEGGTF
jgi:hypothetical protein